MLLESMQHSAERMNRLVGDLQMDTKLGLGKLEIRQQTLRNSDLIQKVIVTFSPLAKAKDVRLIAELDSDLPSVWADQARLFQVFSNLIGNALKFTPANGSITLRTTRRDSQVQFSVEDTGPGIAPNELPNVFYRYWQSKSGSGKGHGLGLGLAIAKGIVEARGGKIWVSSILGQGAAFHFTIPIAQTDSLADAS